MITRKMSIEELVTVLPESVRYLMDRGIKPIVCGEPMWGTLESAAREKGIPESELQDIYHSNRILERKGFQ